MDVEILDITQLSLSGFEDIPSLLYSQNQLPMVPNKVNEENFHSAFFIKNKGRVVLYNNPNLNYENKKAVALGHFECVNDDGVANLLFQEAKKIARQIGASWIIGPMNGSTWDTYRFSLSHDSPNFFLEPYHHLYYNNLWQQSGFEIIATYSSSMDMQMELLDPGKLVPYQKRMDEMGVVIRPIDLENYETEISKVHNFCEAVFKNNFLYTPISEQEFVKKYIPIKGLIDPEYVLMAEDANKNLIAIFFAVPDIYNKTIPTLIVKTIARNPLNIYNGLIQLMANKAISTAKKNGYKQMIHAFMHQDNKSNNVSKSYSGTGFRNYALYCKKIN